MLLFELVKSSHSLIIAFYLKDMCTDFVLGLGWNTELGICLSHNYKPGRGISYKYRPGLYLSYKYRPG